MIATVDRAGAGMRVDRFVAAWLHATRAQVKKLLQGSVLVNDRPVKDHRLLREGNRVRILAQWPPEAPSMILEPEPVPLTIVYEDEALAVIDKPAGMIVHPAAGVTSGTLVNALLARMSLSPIGAPLRPGIVHRLDKDTSGLLAVAKQQAAHLALMEALRERTLKRMYLALVHGKVTPRAGEIVAPIGRHPKHRHKLAVVEKGGRDAITRYRVRAYGASVTLVEVELVTGRTHQIRVHFLFRHHPVVGDPAYGGRVIPELASKGMDRQALHATRLEFVHPSSGRLMKFDSPLPEDFAALLQKIGI